jgi:hypothetical protein
LSLFIDGSNEQSRAEILQSNLYSSKPFLSSPSFQSTQQKYFDTTTQMNPLFPKTPYTADNQPLHITNIASTDNLPLLPPPAIAPAPVSEFLEDTASPVGESKSDARPSNNIPMSEEAPADDSTNPGGKARSSPTSLNENGNETASDNGSKKISQYNPNETHPQQTNSNTSNRVSVTPVQYQKSSVTGMQRVVSSVSIPVNGVETVIRDPSVTRLTSFTTRSSTINKAIKIVKLNVSSHRDTLTRVGGRLIDWGVVQVIIGVTQAIILGCLEGYVLWGVWKAAVQSWGDYTGFVFFNLVNIANNFCLLL